MIKTISTILLLICLLAGCQDLAVGVEQSDVPMKTITDSIGREVTIPVQPKQVACLFTNTGHIITMLGHGDTIVAVSNGLKRDKLLHQIEPVVGEATLVKVGGAVNFEELLKCKVDLFFMPSDMYHDDGLIKKLDQYRIPYIVTEFESIDDQKALVTLMGDIYNEAEEAAAYNVMYDEIVAEVSGLIDTVPMEDRFSVYHSLNEATNTVPSNTLPGEWMAIAGGREVSLETQLVQDNDKYFATLEQIIVWNPQVIFCNEDGVDNYIRTKDQWQALEAVKNEQVYLMPTGISRWGHTTSIETPLAILWTAKTLYPEVCAALDLEAETKDFYKELFEYELSDDQYNDIIEGRGMRLEKDLSDKVE